MDPRRFMGEFPMGRRREDLALGELCHSDYENLPVKIHRRPAQIHPILCPCEGRKCAG